MRYGIVGFGTAGYHALQAIRKYDKEGIVDVYCNTGVAPYNPMLTTYYALGKLSRNGMFPFGSLEEIQKAEQFQYRAEQVLRVNSKTLCIETQKGSHVYDKILIATGARVFCPLIEGLKLADRFLMRTVEDAEQLKERMGQANVRSAVVIGASMVGIKVVEVLNQNNIQTCLVDLAEYIFPLAAYQDVAETIEQRVENQGISLCFNATIAYMEQTEFGQMAVMTDGSRVPADIVVLCIGTRANTEIITGQVKINRGIVVNERMETSVPGIYAAGDCSEGCNLENGQTRIIGLWANANHQGLAAGANMAGHETGFHGNILHNITHFMNMDFIGFGDNKATGDILEYGNLKDGLFIRLICRNGRVVGANILDNFRISGMIKNYMLRLFAGENHEIPDYQRGMLMQAGLSVAYIEEIERKINGKSGTVSKSEDSL